MKYYYLVIIWPDGEQMTITEPTTRRRKLEKARDILNARYNDGTRIIMRPAK